MVGFVLGLVQMVVYAIYRKGRMEEEKVAEEVKGRAVVAEVHPVKANGNDAQKDVMIIIKEEQLHETAISCDKSNINQSPL